MCMFSVLSYLSIPRTKKHAAFHKGLCYGPEEYLKSQDILFMVTELLHPFLSRK